MKPDILFEDRHLLVLYKPAGVPVESARAGAADCVSILKNYLYGKNPKKGEPYLGLVHRIDQPVEGLLVFALDRRTAADLGRQNAGKEMWKTYLAVRWKKSEDSLGITAGDNTRRVDKVDKNVENWTQLVDYLWKDGRTNRSEAVGESHPGAKKAVLSYRVLAQDSVQELVEIRLETGRHHQIRVQMAEAGTPVYGDRKYGRVTDAENVENVDKVFPALCAYRLSFIHPVTRKRMEFKKTPENPAFSKFLFTIDPQQE